MDKVNDDHKPVLITRQNGKPAVVISLEDFQAYEETAYLMASPKNAARLNQAIAEVEAGKTIKKDLLEE
ncbi:type II toxin-antitoxin system prevent-host-death family antitoxin [Photorhabdus sp. UCH-936]|nr:type II toxin-antitoxin system prevent-host-death family antitoxin [Photorhabdus antumapuensis]